MSRGTAGWFVIGWKISVGVNTSFVPQVPQREQLHVYACLMFDYVVCYKIISKLGLITHTYKVSLVN